ncbi:hypothetical protein [Nocardia sp. NPDC050717]|uniref:hypothetical protein n=1 Tax=Nocardia sp. NPDC050717 TaxID=3157221 RepID=UPI0033E60E1F
MHDVNGMTAASAARTFARLLGVRNMTERATDDVQSAQPINGPGPMKVDFIDGPLPSQPPANDHQSKLAAEQEKRQQAQEREQQKPSAPATDQPPAEVPGNQTPPSVATPPQGSPAPAVPVEEHDPLLDAKGPNQDALPMPSTDGREVGKTWTEVRPNGQVVEYTIPEGNGKNTVDAVVKDAAGNVLSTARIVSIEGTANYIRWQDDVGGGSSYFESGGPNGLGYGQHFAPGTSTSGIPTHAFETSPDASKSRTLSLDSSGRVVGVDIGVRNSEGLYDNIHVDNFGNSTMSSTSFGPSGELQSKFTGQMFANRSGWMIDEFDNHWEGEPDKDGNQSWFRVKNGHTYRMNHLGVITDFSLDKDGRPRLDTIFPDGSQTVQSGRTTVHFDASGKEAWKNEIPAPVQPWDVRAWEGAKRGLTGLASVVSDTVGAPFHMMQDGVRGMSSIRVDQYGTFHVTYDTPNRFANAGTAVVGLAKGAAMLYLALPKYAAMTGYDALRGSDFVRGSTTYQPPNRENELVKDLTGIPLKQWKDDTVGSVFEFGSATAASLFIFRSVGIRPRWSSTASVPIEFGSGIRAATGFVSRSRIAGSTVVEAIVSTGAKYGRNVLAPLRKLVTSGKSKEHARQSDTGEISEAPRMPGRPGGVAPRSTLDAEHHGHTSRNVWGTRAQIVGATGSTSRVRQRALEIILSSPDFENFRFTHIPVYSPTVYSGMAHRTGGTQIGKDRFSSRLDLRTTIVHEELHHRWYARGLTKHHPRDGSGTSKLFYDTVERYLKLRGWL